MSLRTLPLLLGIVLTGTATATAAPLQAEDQNPLFLDLSIDAAMNLAKETDKLLLIAWMKTWESESKKLDQFTWSDPAVRAWVREHTVPLQIDGEADQALPGQFRITKFPTTAILRNDGIEAARIVGYVGPEEFVLEAEITLIGRVGGILAEPPTGPTATDPMSWIAFANGIVGDRSRATEAVGAYLWALDNGEEYQPGFRAAYLEFLLKRISSLKHKTLVAKDALLQRRDAIAQAMLAGTAPPVYAHELARFNYWLRREDQALALFRELRAAGDARSEIRAQLFGEILPILCAHELYDQIMQEAGDIQARLQQQAEAYLEFSSSPTANPSRVQKLRKKFVTDCASFYETLLATGRGEDAESVKALLTTTVPTARSYALLIQKAGRLELFKLAQAIGDEAMEELPEGRTRPVETALRNYTQKAGKIKLKR